MPGIFPISPPMPGIFPISPPMPGIFPIFLRAPQTASSPSLTSPRAFAHSVQLRNNEATLAIIGFIMASISAKTPGNFERSPLVSAMMSSHFIHTAIAIRMTATRAPRITKPGTITTASAVKPATRNGTMLISMSNGPRTIARATVRPAPRPIIVSTVGLSASTLRVSTSIKIARPATTGSSGPAMAWARSPSRFFNCTTGLAASSAWFLKRLVSSANTSVGVAFSSSLMPYLPRAAVSPSNARPTNSAADSRSMPVAAATSRTRGRASNASS